MSAMSDTPVDDKRALSLVSAVTMTIDRLRHSIDSMRQLHDQWKDTSGTSINLIAQLTALKTNLGEIHDWLNYALSDLHPQLLQDLDLLMTSCSLLVRNLDALVAQLRQPDHDQTDFAIKLKFVVGGRSMNRLRNVAKNQTDAVNLLLAACKCHTTAQRKILLHKSRQIRKEDAANINTLVRTSRWNGQCIRALTQLSRMIQWFRLLFYLKLFRKGPEEMPTEEEYIDQAAIMRSEAIDRQLEADATYLRRETKLVLMGSPNSGKELIMRQMKVLYAEGYPQEERVQYRYPIRCTVRLLTHAIIDLLRDTGVNLSEDLNQDFAVLLHEVETVETDKITPAAVHAIENLWHSPTFSALFLKNFEIDFPLYAPYFVQELARIATDSYVPSEADIVRLNQTMGGIKELRFNWDELEVHLFNISGYIPDQFRKRWFHQLEGATALIYTVDVSTYDRPYCGQPNESQLLDDFATFESWANSPKFAGSSIMLLLNNFSRFRDKLPHSPLSHFFPDFQPPSSSSTTTTTSPSRSQPQNPAPPPPPTTTTTTTTEEMESAARQFILRRFKDVNRNRLSIYSFWVDLDTSDNAHLYAALKKTLQHIQQRKARSEVWDRASTTNTDVNSRSGTAGRVTPSGGGGGGFGRSATLRSKASAAGVGAQQGVVGSPGRKSTSVTERTMSVS
ncbi:guanine nucleotide-binding protein-like protein alpha-3 subunit [Periconia macrospinosa]|uniref:Guanine nucleotide-binding protein-like protein alpha-3 subunit n=1 Tax=Periconia macrospinosa TaxID=97972 RepID=A0A2V1D8E4_9PLEO|nr:guanine nucleotide-binding protein-like protein alpha-3 subunit [Periconia macrospinosa]